MSKDVKLTRVARIVYNELENQSKPLKPEDIVQAIGIKLRSVRYGLKLLVDKKLIIRYPDLADLRSFYYAVPVAVDQTSIAYQALA